MAEALRQDDPLARRLSGEQLGLILRDVHVLRCLAAVTGRYRQILEGLSAAAEPPASLVALLGCDPALVARLVSLANQHEPGEIWTVDQAVGRLGAEAVRAEVLSAEARVSGAATGRPDSGMDQAAFATHCMAVALAAETLAGELAIDPARAFVAGLLHDLGKAVLAQTFPKSYARVLGAVKERKGNIARFERQVIGVDHTVAGRRLAAQWRLPAGLQDVIWQHHQPPQTIIADGGRRTLIVLVKLADIVARRVSLGFSGNYETDEDDRPLAELLGLPAQAVVSAAENIGDRLADLTHRCGLDRADRRNRPATGPAIAELADLNAELRRLNLTLGRRAKAFEQVRDFAGGLAPDVTVAEVLCRIASSLAAMQDAAASPAEPVIAYAFGSEGDLAFAVRYDGGDSFAWRALRRGGDAKATSGSASETARAVFADETALSDWADLSGYRHEQLIGRGRWVGGVFCRAGDSAPADGLRSELAGILAATLALVQDRWGAVGLSEQLAGAARELAEAQQSLTEQAVRRTVGELAAGAAHELNNPLAVVSGRAQLMAQKATSAEDREIWQLIAAQSQRASDIVTGLMEFAHPPQPSPEAIEVRRLLVQAAEEFSKSGHAQAAAAEVDIQVGEQVPPAWADRAQMLDVLVELITNAATAAQGPPAIGLAARSGEGGAVVLSVTDGGPGMDGRTLAHAFTPFYSAQQAGRRQGLGLARARRYVQNNGGSVRIDSKVGAGTTVTIELPAARGGV